MLVTLFGSVTEVKPVQVKNTLCPMVVTLFGIVIEVNLVPLSNALSRGTANKRITSDAGDAAR